MRAARGPECAGAERTASATGRAGWCPGSSGCGPWRGGAFETAQVVALLPRTFCHNQCATFLCEGKGAVFGFISGKSDAWL